jgi:hypothetical protein
LDFCSPQNPESQVRRLVEELEGIRLALVQGNTGGKVDLVVEGMDAKQARLFSLLDLGKFMGKWVNRLMAD